MVLQEVVSALRLPFTYVWHPSAHRSTFPKYLVMLIISRAGTPDEFMLSCNSAPLGHRYARVESGNDTAPLVECLAVDNLTQFMSNEHLLVSKGTFC
jgi:hypothetical protein